MDYQFLTLAEQRDLATRRAHQLEAEHYDNALARETAVTYPDNHPDKAAMVAQYDANLAVIEASHAAVIAERDRVDNAPDAADDAPPACAVPIEPTPFEPPAQDDAERQADEHDPSTDQPTA